MPNLFRADKTYNLRDIEKISGCLPVVIPGGYAVIAVNDDFSQYDFEGEVHALRLVRIDGEAPDQPASLESGG